MNRGDHGTGNTMRLAVALLATLLGLPATAQLNVGETLPTVILDGESGGRVGGGAWSDIGRHHQHGCDLEAKLRH